MVPCFSFSHFSITIRGSVMDTPVRKCDWVWAWHRWTEGQTDASHRCFMTPAITEAGHDKLHGSERRRMRLRSLNGHSRCTNWTKLNWPATSRPSFTTPHSAFIGHARQCHDLIGCSETVVDRRVLNICIPNPIPLSGCSHWSSRNYYYYYYYLFITPLRQHSKIQSHKHKHHAR